MAGQIKEPEHYAKMASFLGWGESSVKLDQERIDLLQKHLVGKKVLDIGCGLGVYVDYLSSLGYDGWGLDFVKEFIQKAQKERKGNFVLSKAEKLPFPDNSFDSVLLFDILEHGDDEVFLKEAKRVAKKRVLAIVPRRVDINLEQSGVIFRHYLDKSHLREYSDLDIKALAKKAGFKLVFLKEVHPLYNETIFLALFSGPQFIKKIIRKSVFLFLPKQIYPTEIFMVLEKV